MKNAFSIFIVALLLIGCAKFQKRHDKPEEEKYLPSKPILSNQNDSLNYTLGLTNGDSIKSYYLKNDTTTKVIALFFQAFDKAYNNSIERGELFKLGKQIGNSFKQLKAKGLIGDSTLKFEEKFVKQGLTDALNGNYSSMNPKHAEVFIQNSMMKIKDNPSLRNDTSLIQSLNYAFGIVNGTGIKEYKIKGDSAQQKIASLLEAMKEELKGGKNIKYGEFIDLGINIGNSLKEQKKIGLMNITTLKVDIKLIKQGLTNGLRGSKIQMTPKEAQEYLQKTMRKLTGCRYKYIDLINSNIKYDWLFEVTITTTMTPAKDRYPLVDIYRRKRKDLTNKMAKEIVRKNTMTSSFDYYDLDQPSHENSLSFFKRASHTDNSMMRRKTEISKCIAYSPVSVIIGKCQFFYNKKLPSQTLLINGMSVYHNGDFKVKSMNGKYTLYTCTGTVWVIFHTKKAAESSKFLGGDIQTCSDY